VLTVSLPLPDKEGYFVCLFACCGFFYPLQCVCSLSLSLFLMTCTWWFQLILTFFWWHVITAGHFSQKSLSKNPRIGFFPLPIARPCPLTHDPPLPILAGYRLVVPGSRACFILFTCRSCIYRVLEIGLYVLPCTFGFLWHGLFFRSAILYDLLLLGNGPCWIMGLPSPRPILSSLRDLVSIFLLYHSAIPTIMLFDSIQLGLFGPAVYFPPSNLVYSRGLFLHCLRTPVFHFPLRHSWPICFSWTSSALFQSFFPMGLY